MRHRGRRRSRWSGRNSEWAVTTLGERRRFWARTTSKNPREKRKLNVRTPAFQTTRQPSQIWRTNVYNKGDLSVRHLGNFPDGISRRLHGALEYQNKTRRAAKLSTSPLLIHSLPHTRHPQNVPWERSAGYNLHSFLLLGDIRLQ